MRAMGPVQGKHHQTPRVWESQTVYPREAGPRSACAKAMPGCSPGAGAGMSGDVRFSETCLKENSYYKLAMLMLMLWNRIHV